MGAIVFDFPIYAFDFSVYSRDQSKHFLLPSADGSGTFKGFVSSEKVTAIFGQVDGLDQEFHDIDCTLGYLVSDNCRDTG